MMPPIVGSSGLSARDLGELARAQELAVRLFFSDSLVGLYAHDPLGLLASYELPAHYELLLPDVAGDTFRAETYGRRLMIARELSHRFAKTMGLLAGRPVSPPEVVESTFFREFLASDHFFLPERGLPHPYGIGRGYDNVGKFFCWLLSARRLLDTENGDLRLAAFIELGKHLLAQVAHSRDGWFSRFAAGVWWATGPDRTGPYCCLSWDPPSGRTLWRIADAPPSEGLSDLHRIADDLVGA